MGSVIVFPLLFFLTESVCILTQEKLFGVWLKLYKTTYAIAEKNMKVERLKQKIKLLETVCPQLDLLSEWEKLEKKNVEAIGRVTRKLSAYATKLPLVNGAMVLYISSYAKPLSKNIALLNFLQVVEICKTDKCLAIRYFQSLLFGFKSYLIEY